jgi:hypothetical protein
MGNIMESFVVTVVRVSLKEVFENVSVIPVSVSLIS